MPQYITSEAELTALYGPHDTIVATIKEIDHISDHYRMFIERSPFVVVATSGAEGLDCTPRGDPAGFVRVVDKHTVMLPDRRGNNRIDTLRNIVRDPRISLLFLIPGIGRTLRINGRAAIRVDAEVCASFSMGAKVPRSVIVVTAERVYTQCPRALIRSKLWDPTQHIDENSLPSHGTMMKAIQESFAGEEWDRNYPQRLKETMY
jgi:PPOX class probable FMN-dependent enzyme